MAKKMKAASGRGARMVVVNLRLPETWVAYIDRKAAKDFSTRSIVVREALMAQFGRKAMEVAR